MSEKRICNVKSKYHMKERNDISLLYFHVKLPSLLATGNKRNCYMRVNYARTVRSRILFIPIKK